MLVFRPAEISAAQFVHYLLSMVFLRLTFSGELSSGPVPAMPSAPAASTSVLSVQQE